MNVTVLLIVVATIALVVGPLLWLRPTARDRQLTRLRTHARTRGLNVTVEEIAHPDPPPADRVTSGGRVRQPTLNVAAYRLPLHRPGAIEDRHVPVWEVVRLRQERDDRLEDELMAGLDRHWRFSRPGLPLIEDVVGRLSALLQQAPRGTVKLTGDAQAVGLYWRERGDEGEVDAIAELLEAMRTLQLDVSRAAAREEATRQEPE